MRTTLVPVVLPVPTSRSPRSAGVHASSLIRQIAIQIGKLKLDFVEELGLVDLSQEDWWNRLDKVAQLRIGMGLAFEEWYIPLLQHAIVDHPGELCIDGIFMTPDGESIDFVSVTEHAIHEVKLTYKSVNTVGDLTGEFMWISQMQAYCRGAGTCVGFLHPLFVCGDYSWPMRPRLGPIEGKHYCWRVVFTEEEIERNWQALRAVRDAQLELGR